MRLVEFVSNGKRIYIDPTQVSAVTEGLIKSGVCITSNILMKNRMMFVVSGDAVEIKHRLGVREELMENGTARKS